MTRWARANNVHIKKPDDPTPWQKFKNDATLKSSNELTTSTNYRKRHSKTTESTQNAVKKVKNTSDTHINESTVMLPASEKNSVSRSSRKRWSKTCFKCKLAGHVASQCPTSTSATSDVICYKCGSTEHTISNCKKDTKDLAFATCYICGTKGHISRNCPQNTKGIYPDGGGCRSCGSNQHLQKDCPKPIKESEDDNLFADMQDARCSADEIPVKRHSPKTLKNTNRVVKF